MILIKTSIFKPYRYNIKIVNAINSIENKPKLLISTSAVGIYDNKSTHNENGTFSNDFLSNLCQDWEKEALKANNETTKVAILDLGLFLDEMVEHLQK